MRRTEAHQGVRMIKFRSILDRCESSEPNQIEAAELLGVTERMFRIIASFVHRRPSR